MRLHILQHVAFEGPGYIIEWAKNREASITYTRFYESSFVLPSLNDFDFLVILGGPMSVNDALLYPWIEKEKAFIKECLQSEIPILGICLGAQFIANVLGAQIISANNKEIGWFPVSNEGPNDLPWSLFNSKPNVFHWHGEQFAIPKNATGYLISEANNNQAFTYGKNVIGLQFHLEVTSDTIEQLLEHASEDLVEGNYIQTVDEIRKNMSHLSESNTILKSLLDSLTS